MMQGLFPKSKATQLVKFQILSTSNPKVHYVHNSLPLTLSRINLIHLHNLLL
jgi:hypothetical protein